MKKITVLFLCAALLAAASCGNNSNNNKGKSEEPKAATKAEAGKKMDIGDKFAFAGLESSKLVPACAKEISEMETPVRSESRPMKDAAYFYTGTTSTDITIEQLDEFLATAYDAARAAASDGKVYKRGSYGDVLPYRKARQTGREVQERVSRQLLRIRHYCDGILYRRIKFDNHQPKN